MSESEATDRDTFVERIEAQRDGWKAIARELLTVAFGGDLSASDIPPLEILERFEVQGVPVASAAALEQFWLNLGKKHALSQPETVSDEPTINALFGTLLDDVTKGFARVTNLNITHLDDGSTSTTIVFRVSEPQRGPGRPARQR